MVQEIAQKIIATAKERKAQGYLFYPTGKSTGFTCRLETNGV